jgi:hypothetical protein
VQRSFNPSILEGPVTSATDIQACQVTDSKQPQADGHSSALGCRSLPAADVCAPQVSQRHS